MQLNSLQDVLKEQLEDLYDAEHQLVKALPKVAAAASSTDLREVLENHLAETKSHVTRLEQAFGEAGMMASATHCDAMEGLIREGEKVVTAAGDPMGEGAALIAGAQRAGAYEIAGDRNAKRLARGPGL